MTATQSALNRFFNIEESIVGPETVFLSPKTRHLYDWWAKIGNGKPPQRRQFDVTEHRPIVANLFLTEVTPDGEFVFKLFGEDVIQMIGRNSTGERVKSAGGAEYGHALDEYYRTIVADGLSRRCLGSLAFANKEFRRFESVDCPLTSEGRGVDLILGVMDLIK